MAKSARAKSKNRGSVMISRLFSPIKRWVAARGLRRLLPSLIRGGLKAVSGVLIANGLTEEAEHLDSIIPQLLQILDGVAVFAIAQLWSWLDAAKKEETINGLPPAKR
jgi:hypothetical protein